jgi:hypothetical protein
MQPFTAHAQFLMHAAIHSSCTVSNACSHPQLMHSGMHCMQPSSAHVMHYWTVPYFAPFFVVSFVPFFYNSEQLLLPLHLCSSQELLIRPGIFLIFVSYLLNTQQMLTNCPQPSTAWTRYFVLFFSNQINYLRQKPTFQAKHQNSIAHT